MQVQRLDHRSSEINGNLSDEEIAEIIAPYRKELASEMDVVLCDNARDMVKDRPESALGNFFADACILSATREHNAQVDAAMFNTGGIRSSLAAGQVKVGDIYQLMPFDNELVIVEISPEQVNAMLTYLADKGGEPVSGIELSITDGRIGSALIDGRKVEDRNYRILTSDYLARGGDKMEFFTEDFRVSYESLGIKVRDALLENCRSLGEQGRMIDYHKDGRIKKE